MRDLSAQFKINIKIGDYEKTFINHHVSFVRYDSMGAGQYESGLG